MPCTLLVYGWYGRGNLGDELMKQALLGMFEPRGVTLRFVDFVDGNALAGTDGIIFGGGSILYNDPLVSPGAVKLLLDRKWPVFYLGVGGETGPSPVHQDLINVASVVSFRELDTPDLVYSLQADTGSLAHEPEGLLFVPNVELLPTHEDPHWMHAAWERYKDETAQFLDRCTDRGLMPAFMLMCDNDRKQDAWAAAEIVGRMKRRDVRISTYLVSDLSWATRLVRHHRVVVTQRYHGIVLAEMSGVPYVSIVHCDKLRLAWPHRGEYVSFHGLTKDALTDAVQTALASHPGPYVVNRKAYDELAERVTAVADQNRVQRDQVRRS